MILVQLLLRHRSCMPLSVVTKSADHLLAAQFRMVSAESKLTLNTDFSSRRPIIASVKYSMHVPLVSVLKNTNCIVIA